MIGSINIYKNETIVKKAVWIAYDFGLKGDYTGLYTWLDEKEAVECGNGLAFFSYSLNSDSPQSDFIMEISQSLKEAVKLSKSDRVYLIWRDSSTKLIKGEFINGGRKQSPWEGYGKLKSAPKEDSGE